PTHVSPFPTRRSSDLARMPALRALFRLDTGFPDHRGPASGIVRDDFPHIRGTASDGNEIEFRKTLAGLRGIDDLVHGAVELLDRSEEHTSELQSRSDL